jgi:hypothetical protein
MELKQKKELINIIINKNTKCTKTLLGVGAVYHLQIFSFRGSSSNLPAAKILG